MKNTQFILVLSALSLGLVACSHSEKAAESQTPVEPTPTEVKAETPKKEFAYDGHCAASIKAGRYDVKGDPAFSIDHEGKSYCFSSAKARDSFKKDLSKNIATADRNWSKAKINSRGR